MLRFAPVPLLFGMAVVAVVGCSGESTYPVTGQVLLSDGSPLAGGQIEFRGIDRPVSAVGAVGPDGRFELGLRGEGDGTFAGQYRVVLTPPPPPIGHPAHAAEEEKQSHVRAVWLTKVSPKYQSGETSDLEFEVREDSGHADYDIRLEPHGND